MFNYLFVHDACQHHMSSFDSWPYGDLEQLLADERASLRRSNPIDVQFLSFFRHYTGTSPRLKHVTESFDEVRPNRVMVHQAIVSHIGLTHLLVYTRHLRRAGHHWTRHPT